MGVEANSGGTPESDIEGVLREDGSLNESFLSEHYGLGPEEAMQMVQFGAYRGTVAQMIADERCPIGGQMQTAYEEKGIQGVEEMFKGLSVVDPNFSVVISEATLGRERKKAFTLIEGGAESEESQEPENKPPEDPPEDPPVSGAGGSGPVERPVLVPRPGEQTILEAVARQEEALVVESEPAAFSPDENEAIIVKPTVDTEVPSAPEVVINAQEPAVIATTPSYFERPQPVPHDELKPKVLPIAQPELEMDEATEVALPQVTEAVSLPPVQEPGLVVPDNIVPEAPVAEEATETESVEPVIEPEVLPALEPAELAYKLVENLPVETDEVMVQVVEALQSPEAASSETVQIATAEVVTLSQHVQELRAAGTDSAEAEQLLEAACVQLLEALEVPYSDETIEQFMTIVLAAYELDDEQPAEVSQAAGALFRQGTHEYKLPELTMPSFIMRAGRSLLSFQRLGRWAVSRA